MRGKGKELHKVRDGSKKASVERPGKERQPNSSIIMVSAVYRHVQQMFSFVGGLAVANDTGEVRENIQQLLILLEVGAGRIQSLVKRPC